MATHATITGAPMRANPIVAAYLAARANDEHFDRSEEPESVDTRLAQFAREGGRDRVMAWGIHCPEHGALVALLAAERLENLIEGYSVTNGRGQRVLRLGAEEINEVFQIKHAMLNLWRHLDERPRLLGPLAVELGLVDENENQAG